MGEKEKAQESYNEAIQWTERNGAADPWLARLREEAQAILSR